MPKKPFLGGQKNWPIFSLGMYLLGLLSLFPECNPGPISTTPKETTDDPGSATSLKTPGSATLLAITIVTGVLNLHCWSVNSFVVDNNQTINNQSLSSNRHDNKQSKTCDPSTNKFEPIGDLMWSTKRQNTNKWSDLWLWLTNKPCWQLGNSLTIAFIPELCICWIKFDFFVFRLCPIWFQGHPTYSKKTCGKKGLNIVGSPPHCPPLVWKYTFFSPGSFPSTAVCAGV